MTDSELKALEALATDVVETTRTNTADAEKISPPVPVSKPSPSGQGPGIPELPPSTKLDLSREKVQVKGFPEFTIPSYLSVSASTTAITHPDKLSQLDWMTIVRNRRVLYAYTMGTAPKDGDPPQAAWAALDWMIPDGPNYLVHEDSEATVKSEVTYSEGTASYVRAGVDKQQASVGFPFASASFEREHEERHASSSYKKQLQLIGRWYYPRARLILEFCTAASDRFIDAVKNALDDYDRSSNLGPLLDVFRKYGTAVPKEVILGGQMIMVHKEDYQGSVKEDEVKDVVKVAVSIKSKGGTAQGSAGASFQNGAGSTVTADTMSKSIQFTVKGGDTTLASNPPIWPASVKPASEWAVVGRAGMTSILDFLPGDLRARAIAVWPKLPVPPAIWDMQDTAFAQDHIGKAERAQFVLGARKVPDGREGALGAVQLVCGTSMTPQLGRGDAAGGAASFHRERGRDAWIETSSVCLPVPAGHNYAATAANTWAVNGNAAVRFAIAETNLTLDIWRGVEMQRISAGPHLVSNFQASADGFVFCSVEALNNEDHGYVTCEVDDVVIAAASVHNYAPWAGWIRNASFCAPFTKGSWIKVIETNTSGRAALGVRTWQILSTSQAWKFTKPQPFTLGAWATAATDGFVNGVVTANESIGTLRLDCVKDRQSIQDYPIASVSVHASQGNNRWTSQGSAMVPARKDYLIFTDCRSPVGKAQAQIYWTGVVPVVE